jgi:hypothetical protein
MPPFDLESRSEVTRIPFESTYRLIGERLTREEFDAIWNAVSAKIDGYEIHTAGWMPGSDWNGTVYWPIYEKAARFNTDLAARMFGLIVWVVFMNRPEAWITGRFEKDGEPIRSRTYFRDRSSQNE